MKPLAFRRSLQEVPKGPEPPKDRRRKAAVWAAAKVGFSRLSVFVSPEPIAFRRWTFRNGGLATPESAYCELHQAPLPALTIDERELGVRERIDLLVQIGDGPQYLSATPKPLKARPGPGCCGIAPLCNGLSLLGVEARVPRLIKLALAASGELMWNLNYPRR